MAELGTAEQSIATSLGLVWRSQVVCVEITLEQIDKVRQGKKTGGWWTFNLTIKNVIHLLLMACFVYV